MWYINGFDEMVVSEIWWVKCWLIGVCLRQGWTLSHPHRWSACEGQIVWFLESSFCVCRASHLALTFHSCLFSSRASLANCRLNLALVYFEKAVDNVIANKGDSTSELVSLYQEIAQIEQLRRNHEQAIQYLHQVGGLAEVQARRLCLAAGLVPRREERDGIDLPPDPHKRPSSNSGQGTQAYGGPVCCVTWFNTAFPLLASLTSVCARKRELREKARGATEFTSLTNAKGF